MEFEKHLVDYYKGEWLEATLLTVFGMTIAVISVMMWHYAHQNTLLKGLFYPIVFLAIFTSLTGGYGMYNNGQRLAVMPAHYVESPSAFTLAERNRFDGPYGVNTWWVPLKILWAVLTVVGISLSFFTRSDLTHGVAIGLMCIGVVGFLIDGFAYHRAQIYTAALQAQNVEKP